MSDTKKYELIPEKGSKLFRIKALRDFSGIKKGELGGLVESEANLSHSDNAWVYDNARVFDNARVHGDARVYGSARVYENSWVFGSAKVYGSARVFENSLVYGSAKVYGSTKVYGSAKVFENSWVFGSARVFDNAKVYGSARVYGNAGVFDSARVFGSAKVDFIVQTLNLLRYPVTILREGVQVGCMFILIELLKEGLTEEELLEMEGQKALDFYYHCSTAILSLWDYQFNRRG